MQNSVAVEICVESVEGAIAAQRGGAHRIELCTDLRVGGLTPNAELIRQTREQISLPVYAMIRPRAGDYRYTDDEFHTMQRQIRQAKSLGMDGVVLGILDDRATVDIQRTRRLVQLSHPLPVTFHRAFDDCADPVQALEDVICTGASRVLTSGGRDGVLTSLSVLATLRKKSQRRIIIMPGGGVNEQNVGQVIRETGVTEIHSSLGGPECRSAHSMTPKFEDRVRKFVTLATVHHK